MSPAPATYLHNLDPFAIQITETFGIRWYGLSYLTGFVLAYFLVKRIARCGRSTLKPADAADLIFYFALGIMIGGRIGYALFYQPDLCGFSKSFPFWRMLMLHQGGMASHGGMIGLIAASWLYARNHKHRFTHILDLGAFAAPLGLFCGRIANFINGELYGRGPTDVPWAVKFPQEIQHWSSKQLEQLNPIFAHAPQATTYDDLVKAVQTGNAQVAAQLAPLLTARHPSQIYQALLEGLIVFAVLAWVWRKPRRPLVIGSLFCGVYAILRIIGEQFRQPDAHIGFEWLGMTRGQWLSIALLAGGAVLLWIFGRRSDHPMGGWRAGGGFGEPPESP